MQRLPKLWIFLSLVAFYGLRHIPIFAGLSPAAYFLSAGGREARHCYARVRTNSEGEEGVNTCFSVKKGIVTKIWNDTPESGATHHTGYAYPGLWDGHGHVLQYGEMLHSVKLYGAESIDEVKIRIKKYLKAQLDNDYGTPEKWIRGIGWDQANFGGAMPTAKDLEDDPELKGKYIMLDRVDVHCTWVSEAVLKLLPNPLPYVPGGDITTDPGPGVFCDNAMDLPLGQWPKPTVEDRMEYLVGAMKSLHSYGIVGVHDAGVVPEDIELYDELADLGLMTLRIYAMIECPVRNTFCGKQVRKIKRHDGVLSVRSVKLFADGALGSWGAALLEPYSDKPETSGTMLIEEHDLEKVVKKWYAHDYQVNIHAIGDRACHAAIRAFSLVLASSCPHANLVSSPEILLTTQTACMAQTQKNHRRLRIEHSQIIAPADQALMRELGIIASIQPTHATSDAAYALDRLGVQRLNESAYRMRTFKERGIPMVFGSDFPVEPPSPWEGIYAATTRRSPAASGTWRDGGWYEEETVDVGSAFEGFTRGPAFASFMEKHGAGEIKVGGWADWVVMEKDVVVEAEGDPEALRGEGLSGVRVKETWVAGRKVWSEENEHRGVGWFGWARRLERVMGEVERVLGQQGL
ncbi:hypothetical protein P167DRAFT_510079 [Morchella conica CCBAS932]|uniref:Amidohydrolase 3 domain-containing protein n=1 Tax=Morchella conica CCBAS932 TaxID=1392247 RepID=A0A3N4KHC3_9PEZI|nr:hypothetical protein P167DRAFT_510079 [Morchella conica CCBAS932]